MAREMVKIETMTVLTRSTSRTEGWKQDTSTTDGPQGKHKTKEGLPLKFSLVGSTGESLTKVVACVCTRRNSEAASRVMGNSKLHVHHFN